MGKKIGPWVWIGAILFFGYIFLNHTQIGKNLVSRFGNHGGVVLSGAHPGQIGIF